MTLADELASLVEASLPVDALLSLRGANIILRAVEALRAAAEIIDTLPDCDADMHPAWCMAHGAKQCTMRADMAKFRGLLDERPIAAERTANGRV